MAYIRCIQCGSKALVAASQCPKCAHPFNLVDARGERVKLKRCRSCGIMHRIDASCHWCGEVPRGISMPQISAGAMRSAAAIALMVTAVGGAWRYAPKLRDLASAASSEANVNRSMPAQRAAADIPVAGQSAATSASAMVASASADSVPMDAALAAASVAAGDSITWIPAVARTWVNVRSDASRGGQVVGVIKPASRAMLGTDRAGWRQVRSPDVSGWVDPRLFEADSLRTRGE